MPDFFGNYYGLDWSAMVFSLLFLYAIGSKKRYAFILGIISNILWIVVNQWAHINAGIAVNVILVFLNIRGYINWKKI